MHTNTHLQVWKTWSGTTVSGQGTGHCSEIDERGLQCPTHCRGSQATRDRQGTHSETGVVGTQPSRQNGNQRS